MRRQSGFFLGDVGFLSDPKFRKLARRLPEPDDFNAAVGAYFIALAAARKKGSPEVDVEAETESRFVGELRAVGLLTEGGFPEKAFLGWAPSRPPRPNEVVTKATNVTKGDEKDRSDSPSFTLPSSPIQSLEEDPASDFDSLDVYHELTQFRPWGSWSGDEIKAAIRDYGDATVTDALRAEHARDLARDSLWKRTKARLAKDADRHKDEAKAKPRPGIVKVTDSQRVAVLADILAEGGA